MHGLAVRYRSKEGSIEMKEAVMSGSEKEPKTGKFLGIPYDLRRPTLARLKSRWWNPEEPRLFPPKSLGWAINFARLFGRKPKS